MMFAPDRWTRTDLLICSAALVLFGLMTFHDIRLPGPHTDEVFPAAPAVNFYNARTSSEPLQIDPSVVTIAGRPIPLMLLTYVGAPQTFLYVPAFALFGDNIAVVRGLPIVLAGAGIAVWYLFLLLLLGRPTAVLSTGFVLADPGFIFFVGRDFGPPALALLAKALLLLFLLLWWRSGRRLYLAVAAAAAGLGFYHKADFLWLIVAVAVAAVLVYRRDLKRHMKAADVITAVAAFAVASAPVVLMNALTGGATFWLLHTGVPIGEQVLQWWNGIGIRIVQLGTMLNGTAPYRLFMAEPPVLSTLQTLLLPSVIAAGSLLLIGFLMFRGNTARRRPLLFMLLVTAIVLLLSGKSPTFLMEHHLLALALLMHAAAAAGIIAAVHIVFTRRPRILPAVLPGVLLFCATTGVWTVGETYTALEQTGGRGYWSDAIYALGDYLRAERRPVALMEWGFTNNLIVVTGGELRAFRLYKDFMEQGARPEAVLPYVNPGTLFVFHTPAEASFAPAFDALRAASEQQGYSVHEIRRFADREGRDVYIVYDLAGTR